MTPGESTRPWPETALVVRIAAPASAVKAPRMRRFMYALHQRVHAAGPPCVRMSLPPPTARRGVGAPGAHPANEHAESLHRPTGKPVSAGLGSRPGSQDTRPTVDSAVLVLELILRFGADR